MRARVPCRTRLQGALTLATVLATAALAAGCGDRNLGVDPPDRSLFFPSGLLVDSTATTANGEAKYLLIANGNNDLRFNAGTLAAVDLERFFGAWLDPATGLPFAYCETGAGPDGLDRCVEPPGGPATLERPCRRLALKPQVVECDERAFIDEDLIVHVGDFATVLATSTETDGDDTFTRAWLPVRGDPSLTYVDIKPDGDRIALQCEQGTNVDEPDALLCGDAHRLRNARNDDSLSELAREPYTMMISDSGNERLAFVAHADGAQMTLVALDGVPGDSRPAIVDQVNLFVRAGGIQLGGFGVAERPCFAAGQGPMGEADPDPNVPSLTNNCERPLVYAGYRFAPFISSFTASGLDLPEGSDFVAPTERTDCFVDAPTSCGGALEGCTADPSICDGGSGACQRVYAGQYCATPDQIGQPCAVVCDPQIRADRTIIPGGLFPAAGGAVLGDIAFADPRGDALLVLQTNPGALLVLDTSLGDDGEPLDQPSSPPIEICGEPTRMVVHDDMGQRFALITCFASALVYVVDLDARRVVDTIIVGTGPHDLTIDAERQVLYVANTLESSVSVVDLSRQRATRFQELARIGLQEPFER